MGTPHPRLDDWRTQVAVHKGLALRTEDVTVKASLCPPQARGLHKQLQLGFTYLPPFEARESVCPEGLSGPPDGLSSTQPMSRGAGIWPMLAQCGSSRSLCHPGHTEKQETQLPRPPICPHVSPTDKRTSEKPSSRFLSQCCGTDFNFPERAVEPGVDSFDIHVFILRTYKLSFLENRKQKFH